MLSVSWSRNAWWVTLKWLKGGQLDDGANVALEEDRQHDDVERCGLPQPGVDPHVVARDVGQEDALLLQRALTDETITDHDLLGLVRRIRIAGETLQQGAVILTQRHLVNGALL